MQRILEESDNKHYTERRLEPTEFLIDSFVLVNQHLRHDSIRRGVVFRREYTLLDLTTNKEKKCHISQMKQFRFDSSNFARKDHVELFVDHVSHRGGTKRLSTQ